jgi:5,10-methenyltetrahydrofolate synthetase
LGTAPHTVGIEPRPALRQRLRARRDQFAAGPDAAAADIALGRHLAQVLAQLEPLSIGVCWPLGTEFNAVRALAASVELAKLPWALPFTQREPRRMHYRAWDGSATTSVDECGIPSSDGPSLVPDVVLVPCVGYTRDGYRLGYGGGYFDRWLAEHPHVTSVGLSWAIGEIDPGTYEPQAHDIPLTLVVNEHGVVT